MNKRNCTQFVSMTLLGLMCSASSVVFAEENETTESVAATTTFTTASIGKEISVAKHLMDGSEYRMNEADLIRHGKRLFNAV